MTIIMVVMLSVGLSSCGNNDDGDGASSGLKGWYTDLSKVAKQSDFEEINKAIDNNEVLSSYRYGGQIHYHYATRDEFIDSNGCYNDSKASFGRLRFSIFTPIEAIHIVDGNTLLDYNATLYEDGRGPGDAVYRLNAGRIFGNMTYYATPINRTYTILEDKLIVSNGDIYTIVDNGLIPDGSSRRWSKYDPNKRY